MSRLKDTPTPNLTNTKGYWEWNAKGIKKKTVVMNHQALIQTWEQVHQYTNIVKSLEATNSLPDNWNKHDEKVITGFEKHIAPYDIKVNNKLGEFLDPTEEQLHKYYLAVKKIHSKVEDRNITKKEMLDYLKIDTPLRELTKSEMFEHCEQRRQMKKQLEQSSFFAQ